jgi:hypothetical protein
MHDGKHGRHLEPTLDDVGKDVGIWALVNYGPPNHSTEPVAQLVMTRADWLQLGDQIDAMNRTEVGGDPPPARPPAA